MIYFYHAITIVLLPIYILVLIWRIIRKKEDPARIQERFGFTTKTRPNGILIWLHAASVGESAIAITLVENISLVIPEPNLLVTTGSIASSKIITTKLPKNAIHQFLPIDNLFFTRKFLKYWQPKLGIFIEAEIWPGLLTEAAKKSKLLLLNGHMSHRSFKRWSKFESFFQNIIMSFSEVATQSNFDFERYKTLGTNNLTNLGNIKFANKKLLVNSQDLESLLKLLSGKKVVVFASTHLSDEKVVLNVIKPLKEQFQDCYFIVILRHPERKYEIIKMCKSLKLSHILRSQSKIPNLEDDLYIVDSFGELGLFYSLAYISFVGGSFNKGGHNPIEPAHFSNLILFGPNMSNCQAVADAMISEKAAIQFNSEQELLDILRRFLKSEGIAESQIYRDNAGIFVEQHQQIFQNYLALIKKYL